MRCPIFVWITTSAVMRHQSMLVVWAWKAQWRVAATDCQPVYQRSTSTAWRSARWILGQGLLDSRTQSLLSNMSWVQLVRKITPLCTYLFNPQVAPTSSAWMYYARWRTLWDVGSEAEIPTNAFGRLKWTREERFISRPIPQWIRSIKC